MDFVRARTRWCGDRGPPGRRVLKPGAAERDAATGIRPSLPPWASWASSASGPRPYGGAGLDSVLRAGLSEVSRGDASVGVIMSVCNSLYCHPILNFGSEEQKRRYLAPVAGGKTLGCFGLTEAGAGSDPASLRTTAVKDGDAWVLNGEKKFITNGNLASLAVIAAKTDPAAGGRGISSFIVDLERTKGFKVGRVEDKLGIRASGTAELVFEDARIPGENLLGEPGAGLRQMLATLDAGRIGIGAQALGIGRAVLEESLAYARTREQFGRPIAEFQAIQWKLADMAVALDAAELLLLKAAWLEDRHECFEREAAQAKLLASDAAMAAAVEGVQILGGYGYCTDYPMERHLRTPR